MRALACVLLGVTVIVINVTNSLPWILCSFANVTNVAGLQALARSQ